MGNICNDDKVFEYKEKQNKMKIIMDEFDKITDRDSRLRFMTWVTEYTNNIQRVDGNYELPIDTIRVEGSKRRFFVKLYYATNNYPFPFKFTKLLIDFNRHKKVDGDANSGINEYRNATKKYLRLGNEAENEKMEFLPFLLLPMDGQCPDSDFIDFSNELNKRTQSSNRICYYRHQLVGSVYTTNGEKLQVLCVDYKDIEPRMEFESNRLKDKCPKYGVCMFVVFDNEKYNHHKFENVFADSESAPTFIKYSS